MSRDLLEHAELASEAKRKLYVARCDRDSLAKEKKRVEHSLHLTQKLCGMREVQESREVKRMINENEVLRDKLQKNVGKYITTHSSYFLLFLFLFFTLNTPMPRCYRVNLQTNKNLM